MPPASCTPIPACRDRLRCRTVPATRKAPVTQDNKKPITGVVRRWVAGTVNSLSREKQLAVSPLRYRGRHHQEHAVLTGRCDICKRVSPWDACDVKRSVVFCQFTVAAVNWL